MSPNRSGRYWLLGQPASTGKSWGCFPTTNPTRKNSFGMMSGIVGQRYALKDVVEYNKGGHQWPADASALEDLARRCDVMIHATAE